MVTEPKILTLDQKEIFKAFFAKSSDLLGKNELIFLIIFSKFTLSFRGSNKLCRDFLGALVSFTK